MLSWIFRKFWSEAPRFQSEEIWSPEMEEDGIWVIYQELRRIAEALEGIHYHVCDCEDCDDHAS